MQIARRHSWKKVTAQLLLLALPTIALVAYQLWDVNRYYSVLENRYPEQSLFFTCGIVTSILFYGYRFRFITTAAVLALVLYFAYHAINQFSFGEFDAFFVSVRSLLFALLFVLGWVAGYGLSRSRYFTVLWSVLLLALQMVVVSRTAEISANAIIIAFAPVLLYAFYIIYTAELVRNMNEDETRFGWFIGKRLTGFALLAGAILFAMLVVFKKDFKAIENEFGGSQGAKGGQESMTKENRDGSISNKNQMQMTGSLRKDKRLVFVARVDNFFEDGRTPNPLYFTSLYYTRFDTATQTFEVDDKAPYNDLFSPDPSKIPLYFSRTDSSVLKNSGASKARKVITADVYKAILSPNEYLAPSTAFYCQPIAVENDYKEQFKSAYRAKMWVSDLNSAYFIYNPAGNPMLELYQEARFNELRKAASYSGIDKKFMDYYTYMPPDQDYKRVSELANEITSDANTPVDKVVALRNYFLRKDEYGQPLFRYSDNPGVPGLPSASKLNYFLFENRKGYCAYYAGATLFMLRALGIPSRIAAGFLTVDRSSKNTGWYWFYADQAHAWVQVFFPGYGWIDFDTTIPDENTQQASQPDGTPPMNIQQALLVADGKAVSVDTVGKKMTMKVNRLMYHDKNYTASTPKDLYMDVSIASVTRDTGAAKLSDIKKGTDIVAVSFAEVYKNETPTPADNLESIINRSPKPAPIDEVKIMESAAEKKKKEDQAAKTNQPFDWWKAGWITLGVIAGFILLLLLSPWLIWLYLNNKAKASHNLRKKSGHIFTAATYYLNQMGYARHHQGPDEFARSIDEIFHTGLSRFNAVYQKIKYSNIAPNEEEAAIVNNFYTSFINQVKQNIPLKTRLVRFLNIYNTIHFFSTPKAA